MILISLDCSLEDFENMVECADVNVGRLWMHVDGDTLESTYKAIKACKRVFEKQKSDANYLKHLQKLFGFYEDDN